MLPESARRSRACSRSDVARVVWTPAELPGERHVVVQPHGSPATGAKAHLYDSEKGNGGGSGPFDWNLNEAVDRARQFADDRRIGTVVVLKARRTDHG